jgi:TonB-dependent starch-binding outer membrane protein SusC
MPLKNQLFLRSAMLSLIFLFCSIGVFAQKAVIGKVTNNATGQPLVGATVAIKGTTSVTVTGNDGTFSINAPANATLLVTSIGFETIERAVGGKSDFTFSLSEATNQLNEVLVTGYTAQRKKDFTGSVAVVNVKDLKAVPAGSPEQMLQGRAAGLNIITSGQPGSSSNIRVRGITNFGNVNPLVIVDGVESSLTNLNAAEIESIQVLKDAAVLAIYGAAGSNGVIIVTTKRGRAGRAVLNYEAYIGKQYPASGNPFNLLDTKGMADLTWLALKNSGQPTNHPQYGSGATPVIPDYILNGGAAGIIGTISAADLAKYNVSDFSKPIYQIVAANKQGTNWFKEIFAPAGIQSHTVTASGGNDKNTYLLSMNYFNQQGTLMGTYLKRYSVRANTTYNITKNIRLGENLYIFNRDNPQIGNQSEGNAISMVYREQPIIPVYDVKGGFAGTAAKGLGNAQNPVANQTRTFGNKGNSWDIQGNVFAEVDFLKHFTAKTTFGGTMSNFYYYNYGYRTYENAENNGSNSFSENAGYNRQWTWTNTIKYSNVFKEKHALTVIAGVEAKEWYGRGVGGGSLGLFTDNPLYRILNNGSSGFTNYSYAYQRSLYSVIAKAEYAYNEKYLFNAVFRRDGYSAFGPLNRYGNFPSFGAAWRISREKFMSNVKWIDDLKIRYSWGKVGNYNNVDPTNAFSQFGSSPGGSYYDINGSSTSSVQGFNQTRIGNPYTGWEENVTSNFGVDALLFKSKLDVSIDIYKKKVNGLLFGDQAAAVAGGATLPTINIGDVQNTGIDASVTYRGIANKDFKYDVGVIFTAYKSNIINIPGDYFTAGGSRIGDFVRNQGGNPIGSFYGYEVVGIFQDASDVSKSATQDGAKPGRFKYRDANGDKVITDADRVFFGNPNPDFTLGLNLGAQYKNFDFSTFFYGSFGNDVINYVRYWTDFYPSFQGVKSLNALNNSWLPTRTATNIPIAENDASFSTNQVPNSYYREDGSYFRCKSMIVGYTMPTATLKKFGIEKLRLYVQAANLFTITKYTGLDPELSGSSSAFGIDYGNYPNNQRNINIGVNVTF